MGFLDRLLGQKAQPRKDESRQVLLAFVLLSQARCPNAETVIRCFQEFEPTRYRIGEETAGDSAAAAGQILSLQFDNNDTALVALMPAPVPNHEADDGAKFSVSSFGTGWKLPDHQAHLVVTVQSAGTTLSVVDQLSRFTSLIAAVVQASDSVGIYWGQAGATHDPKFFLSVANHPQVESRIMVWTGVSIARESNGKLSLLSLGMQQLNLPDLLLVASDRAKSSALETFFDLLSYSIDLGKPLPEGDTIGRSAEEKLPIHYVYSPIDKSKKVWRVELN